MKRLITLLGALLVLSLYAQSGNVKHTDSIGQNRPDTLTSSSRDIMRDPPFWSVSTPPLSIMTSFYDYMIGSYNQNAVSVMNNGVYFMTFQGKRASNPYRRVFSACVGDNTLWYASEITMQSSPEGFPALTVDSVIQIPLYAWQVNADNDPALEVQYACDVYLDQIPGILSAPVTAINNPITITDPNNVTSTDNVFIWPQIQSGPSPVQGMRRMYIVGFNSTHHTGTAPCSAPYIAYIDYDYEMILNDEVQNWTYVSVPELNAWSNATQNMKEPYLSMCLGNDGKVFLVGYHDSGFNGEAQDTNDLDVFVNNNYGVGAWTRYTSTSHIVTGNPHTVEGVGYFTNDDGEVYADEQICYRIADSNHFNATVDASGNLHMIGMFTISNGNNVFWPEMNTVKEITFDSETHQFGIREIYPVAGISGDQQIWKPWDTDGDNVTDSYDAQGNPSMVTDWNFPYWDETAHDGTMCANYNSLHITEPNAQGWMAAVWQNSNRARQYNKYEHTEYSAYANAPEIYIAVSNDNGNTWCDPIVLNSVDVPQLASNCPMWVYPANKIKMNGTTGKLGLMFYSDNSWGSYVISPSVGANNGGTVKFMELSIDATQPAITGITGIVTRTTDNWLVANATITCNDVTAHTNMGGAYTIEVPAGTHSMTVCAPGYNTTTINNIVVHTNQLTTRNVSLIPLPPITISGVVSRNNPPSALPGCSVILSGVANYTATTNASGMFTISNVIANQTYNYSVSHIGYTVASGTITVGTSNYIMQAVFLTELTPPPNYVYASSNNANNQALITWAVPVAPMSSHLTSAEPQRNLIGYSVWRLTPGNEANQASWVSMSELITQTSYIDLSWGNLPAASYIYAVKAVYTGYNMSSAAFSNQLIKPVGVDDPLLSPLNGKLMSAYPNPFRSSNTLAISLPKAETATIQIYNIRGALVRTLYSGNLKGGVSNISWNGCNDSGKPCAKGMYFCHLITTGRSYRLKLLLIE